MKLPSDRSYDHTKRRLTERNALLAQRAGETLSAAAEGQGEEIGRFAAEACVLGTRGHRMNFPAFFRR